MGPVQVLVVRFEHPTFSGEVLAELTRLGEAGIVRLVDLLLVSRREDGRFETVDPPGVDQGRGALAAAVLGLAEGEPEDTREPGDPGGWSLADALPPGSFAAVALIEHTWAGPLRATIQRAGGTPVEETWLTPDDVGVLEGLVGS